ncbi:MAG TPA: methylated-DNA--[protein]-cysteine S-methyltransferase [Verrucomicrobiae bacterium]|nr:methylated-DNA--[protein]-cysteine S-methyltransferase [Verrucomicrobiae bacterium]
MDNLVRNTVSIQTKLGTFHAHYSPHGITSLDFPESRNSRAPAAKDKKPPAFVRTLGRQLKQYAAGKSVRWEVPVDLSSGTDFQQRVWRVLAKIPCGQTRSYAWVAQKLGKPKAARAVGAACGANPVPVIIPCHRVVASNGALGGFGGGLPMKKRLLRIEHTRI